MDSPYSADDLRQKALENPEEYMLCEVCSALLPQEEDTDDLPTPREIIHLLDHTNFVEEHLQELEKTLNLLKEESSTMTVVLQCPYCKGYKFEKNPKVLKKYLLSKDYKPKEHFQPEDWV